MLKEARLDVHLVKKLQHRARDLSQSSDPIVGELSTIVQQLADGYVGISVAVRHSDLDTIFDCLKYEFLSSISA